MGGLVSSIRTKKKKHYAASAEEIYAARQGMIQQYELHLNNIKHEIERLNQMNVDFDDEGDNSAYKKKCDLEETYMQFYKELCRITGCSDLTGRPIEKKINLTDVTPFPLLNENVAQYMNKQSISFVPDFSDVLNVVKHENQGLNPRLEPQEIGATAEKLHRRIMNVLRSRRYQDFHISLPVPPIAITAQERSVKDPADSDEKLRKKLEDNRNEAMTEHHVLADFLDKTARLLKEKSSGLNAYESSDEESSGDNDIDDDGSSAHSRLDADEENLDSD